MATPQGSHLTTLAFHGAAGTVTGSCYELRHRNATLLIDCGLFQGPRSLEKLNFALFEFDPAALAGVIVTHAHLDHAGLLPRLAAQGFTGPVWCTPATAELLQYLLLDAARLNEQDAARRNRRWDRADEAPIEPLYTIADAQNLLSQLRPVELCASFTPCEGVTARFWNAGHVLGSASIELTTEEVRILFSGDLGPQASSLLAGPNAPTGLDHVIMEATYGDRDRPEISIDERRSHLRREVEDALGHGGNLLIPAFALERTQELLVDLATLIRDGKLRGIRVFIDAPLATKITEVFARHAGELEAVAAEVMFHDPAFHYVEDVQQSRALANLSGAIIIAGSGMCEGGRIRHHLLNNLSRPDSTLLFVGYQAAGTLGRTILEGARRVRLSGETVAVRLRVREIGSYSAHADRSELIDWCAARGPIRGSLFIVHGEAQALASLKQAVDAPERSIMIPEIGELYALSTNKPAKRLRTGDPEIRRVVSRDWQNDYADLAVNLKKDLSHIADEQRRREAIARMRAVLDSFRAGGDGTKS